MATSCCVSEIHMGLIRGLHKVNKLAYKSISRSERASRRSEEREKQQHARQYFLDEAENYCLESGSFTEFAGHVRRLEKQLGLAPTLSTVTLKALWVDMLEGGKDSSSEKDKGNDEGKDDIDSPYSDDDFESDTTEHSASAFVLGQVGSTAMNAERTVMQAVEGIHNGLAMVGQQLFGLLVSPAADFQCYRNCQVDERNSNVIIVHRGKMNFSEMLHFVNHNPGVDTFTFHTSYAYVAEDDTTTPDTAVRVAFYAGGKYRSERDESLHAGGFCTFVRKQ